MSLEIIDCCVVTQCDCIQGMVHCKLE